MKHQLTCYVSALLLVLLAGCNQNSSSPAETALTEQAATSESQQSESARLNAWLNTKYEEELSRSPMTLTVLGRKDQYDRLDDASEAALAEQLAWQAATVAELEASFDYDALDDDARISYDLWRYNYELAQAMEPFQRHEYLFEQMDGMHSWLPTFLINYHGVDSLADMQAYVQRLTAMGKMLGQYQERAELAASQGIRPPRFAYEFVLAESRKMISGLPFTNDAAQGSPLWTDAMGKIDGLQIKSLINDEQKAALIAGTRAALIDAVGPAYEQLIGWVEQDLANTTAEPEGVWSLPMGDQWYAMTLRNMTTTDLSAEEIHNIGLSEVARIREEMTAIIRQTGFAGTLAEFFEFLRTDSQFYYPNTDAGREAYLSDVRGFVEGMLKRLPEYFGILPKAGLEVRRVEAFREQDGGAAHYMNGSPDGARPGAYYSHLSDMQARPSFEMETTTYHESVPGHHMQISIQQELENIPEFRKQAGFTSYVEGWGLYAEGLAKEMGGFTDPYKDFGRLNAEIFRAVRLVVDTGLHAKGWTEEQAVNYALENSSKSESAIRSEIKRYLVLPGQATAYKIGMLKIVELRARAETALGNDFDIRAFHDLVLGGGALPLAILEQRVDGWIQANDK